MERRAIRSLSRICQVHFLRGKNKKKGKEIKKQKTKTKTKTKNKKYKQEILVVQSYWRTWDTKKHPLTKHAHIQEREALF